MYKQRKIGIFGGSFDPPHKGHKYAVQLCVEKLHLDFVYVIPNNQNPEKQESKTSSVDRLNMVQSLFSNFSNVEVNDIEVKRKGMSYTIDTINELHLEGEVFLIIGEELWKNFISWKSFETLIQKVNIIVIQKSLKKNNSIQNDSFSIYRKYICTRLVNSWELITKKRVIFLENDQYFNINSTLIKNKIRLGLSMEDEIPKQLIEDVKHYYDYLKPIDREDLKKSIIDFLHDKGGLQSEIFQFDKSVYDYILITSGLNKRHVRALFQSLVEHLKQIYNITPLATEGESLQQWIVMDYGFLIVHVFYDYLRKHYQLEELWEKKSI